MTDSGAQGALVILDIASGKAHRALDGAQQTQVDHDVKVQIGSKELHEADGAGASLPRWKKRKAASIFEASKGISAPPVC